MNQVHRSARGTKKLQSTRRREGREEVGQDLRERMDDVRDMVENLREKAEVAFRERPYLVPVAACAVGVGIGVLLGSRLTRFLVFTAVGSLVSDRIGGELKRLSRDFVEDLQSRLGDGEEEELSVPG